MSEHEACPFCGTELRGMFWDDGTLIAAMCECGATGPTVYVRGYASYEEAAMAAIELWDQREEAADE